MSGSTLARALPTIESLIGAGAALAMAFGFLIASYAVARRLCRSCDTLTRWVATAATAAWLATALFHLLAFGHAFAKGPAIAALALLGTAACWAAGRSALLEQVRRDQLFASRALRVCLRSSHRVVIAAFVLCTLPPVLRAVIIPPLGWDTLTYHSVKAAMWVQEGGVLHMNGPGPWAYYRNMPGGAEVFLAWAMLPLTSDALATLVDVAEWLALGLSAMALARRIGIREPFASTAAGFLLAIPTVRLMLASGYSELCLLSMFLAGLLLGLAAARTHPGLLALAGGALGISAATKYPMIPVTGVVLIVLVTHAFWQGPVSRRAWAGAAIAAYAVALGPWLIATSHSTGHLLSPMPLQLGPFVLGTAPPEVSWLIDRPLPPNTRSELSVLGVIFSLGKPGTQVLGALCAIPIAGMVAGIGPMLRRRRTDIVPLLAGFVVSLAVYFSPGLSVIRHHWALSSSRFLLPAVAVATAMSMSWCRRHSAAAMAFRAALVAGMMWNLATYAFVGFSKASILATTGVLAAVLLLGALFHAVRRLQIAGPIAAVAVALVAIGTLQYTRDALRFELFQHDFAIHGFDSWDYWRPAIATVDARDRRYRIAVTSGPRQNNDQWFVYPFMGSRLENELVYVPISMDGHIRPFGGGRFNDDLVRTADFEAWRLRLQRRHVTHVISFAPASIELGWMEHDSDDFERVAGETRRWGIFRLRGA